MSTNPNKLAFKGTPGPWHFHQNFLKSQKELRIYKYPEGVYGNPTIAIIPENGEKGIANAHLISAAPEAVAFIADILYSLSCDIPNMDIPEMIHRGEQILKKAYNF